MVTLNLSSASALQHIKPSQYQSLKDGSQHNVQLGRHNYHVQHTGQHFDVSPTLPLPADNATQTHQQHRAAQMRQILDQFPELLASHINKAADVTETQLRRHDNFMAVDAWVHEATERQTANRLMRDIDDPDTPKTNMKSLSWEPPTDETREALEEWVDKPELADVNLRSLGNWTLDQQPWVERNRSDDVKQGKTPPTDKNQAHNIPNGAVLNAPDEAWTDYLNQGWMQSGVNIGAAFKLETQVPQDLVDAHNHAASSAAELLNGPARSPADLELLTAQADQDLANYLQTMTRESGTAGPSKFLKPESDGSNVKSKQMTYFAQELIDLASSGYRIHQDSAGKQVAMPHGKAETLESVLNPPPLQPPPPHGSAT